MKMRTHSFLLITTAIAWSLSAHSQDLPEIIEHAKPSVVTVITKDKTGRETGLGSGFVVRKDGIIATAWHVVDKAASVKVQFTDGKTANVVGTLAIDKAKDFVLLKASVDDLPVIPLGDASALRQGEKVLAIGSPLGLEFTVSDGIVSAFRRLADGTRYLQISAPISHGNSGGPILDSKGNVIGVAVSTSRRDKASTLPCQSIMSHPAYKRLHPSLLGSRNSCLQL